MTIDSTITPIITEESSNIFTSLQIDLCQQYFLVSSDNPWMDWLNVTFDETCYENLHRDVLISLSAKNKFGFIKWDF